MAEQLDLFETADEWTKKLKDRKLVQLGDAFLNNTIKYEPPPKPAAFKKGVGTNYQLKLKKQWPDNPTCPCGCVMVERLNSYNNSRFWGCSNYPECRNTKQLNPR